MSNSFTYIINVFLDIFILLIISSCTTPVFLTRTVAPELVLEKRPARIVFSNQFDYKENPGIKDKP